MNLHNMSKWKLLFTSFGISLVILLILFSMKNVDENLYYTVTERVATVVHLIPKRRLYNGDF